MKRALLISFIFVFIGAVASPTLLHGIDDAHCYILVVDDLDRTVELLVNHNKNQNNGSDKLTPATAAFSFLLTNITVHFDSKERHAAIPFSIDRPLYLLFHSFLFYD